MKRVPILFPSLCNSTFVEANLDSEARLRQNEEPPLKSEKRLNPFLDPETCNQFVQEVARRRGVTFTYGGYLEDRRFLWSTSYLDSTKNYLHLGVDFNVPSGTLVASLFDGEVVWVDDDYDLEGGWGPRVIIRPMNNGPYAIYAHLADVRMKVGDLVSPGSEIAVVGQAPYNGNWYSHLHLQTVQRNSFEALARNNLKALDGYGSEEILPNLRESFPNPLQFEWLVGKEFTIKTL